jgi:hypothetical protein
MGPTLSKVEKIVNNPKPRAWCHEALTIIDDSLEVQYSWSRIEAGVSYLEDREGENDTLREKGNQKPNDVDWDTMGQADERASVASTST